jgi:hypothetical protein
MPLTHSAAYDMTLTAPHARSMWQAMAVDYMWDDHDFGPNDSDGTSPSRLAAISSYSRAVPVLSPLPSGSCSPQTGEIFHSFSWGRCCFRYFNVSAMPFLLVTHVCFDCSVLVIRMDLRSQKFPEKSSVMSICQMNWLKQQFSQCAAYDLVILVSSFNWIGQPEGKLYGWTEFAADRQAIANAIESNQCTDKLILLAGDAHMLAFDDGANSNYASTGSSGSKGFPVVRLCCHCFAVHA